MLRCNKFNIDNKEKIVRYFDAEKSANPLAVTESLNY